MVKLIFFWKWRMAKLNFFFDLSYDKSKKCNFNHWSFYRWTCNYALGVQVLTCTVLYIHYLSMKGAIWPAWAFSRGARGAPGLLAGWPQYRALTLILLCRNSSGFRVDTTPHTHTQNQKTISFKGAFTTNVRRTFRFSRFFTPLPPNGNVRKQNVHSATDKSKK